MYCICHVNDVVAMIDPNGDILLYYVMKVAPPAMLNYGRQMAAEHHSFCDCAYAMLWGVRQYSVFRLYTVKNLNATFENVSISSFKVQF